MEEKTKKLEQKFQKEKKELKFCFVAERKEEYRMVGAANV